MGFDFCRNRAFDVKQGIDRRTRIQFAELLQDLFTASHAGKPVMNQSHFHFANLRQISSNRRGDSSVAKNRARLPPASMSSFRRDELCNNISSFAFRESAFPL